MHDFSGRTALVTGAASGIGEATARAFAEAKARVALLDVDEAGLDRVRNDLPGEGHVTLPADVSDTAAVDAAFTTLRTTFEKLDFAHNNAGVSLPRRELHEIEEADFDRSLAVNLKSVWLCLRREIPWMLEQGGGAIVNTASVTSLVATKTLGAYGTAKTGVLGLTKVAALEYADRGIRINAVCPGAVRTSLLAQRFAAEPEMEQAYNDMHPIGRMSEPAEVAEAVLWLCGPGSSFVVGHALVADGGWTLP